MGAVQLLRVNSHSSTTTSLASTPPPDYHREANHYEEKLIQVRLNHIWNNWKVERIIFDHSFRWQRCTVNWWSSIPTFNIDFKRLKGSRRGLKQNWFTCAARYHLIGKQWKMMITVMLYLPASLLQKTLGSTFGFHLPFLSTKPLILTTFTRLHRAIQIKFVPSLNRSFISRFTFE